MKRPYAGHPRRKNRSTVGVALFPFLAVLMCTMGSLVLLLIVINRQARTQAAEAARAAQAAPTAPSQAVDKKEEIEAAREVLQWQIAQLKTSRQRTEEQVADARLDLGHLEEHQRALQEKAASLQAAYAELEKLKNSGSQQRQALEGEIARAKDAVAQTQKRIADTQAAAQEHVKSYAIVPYEGPNETHRRPIYLECREDAVILQPEGIRFGARDFEGELGPGNPLDAALRAVREYLLAQKAIATDRSAEPYPLLLVRPDGIESYYAARAAMKSWGTEFGYELIGGDWQLKFPRPDPLLGQTLERTVAGARVRQQQLADVAPSHYGRAASSSSSAPRPMYRAAPSGGGIIAEGGAGSGDSPAYASSPPQRGFGSQFAPAGTNDASAAGTAGSSATAGGSGAASPGLTPPTSTSTPPAGQAGQPAAAPRPGEWTPYEKPKDPPKPSPEEEKEKKKCDAPPGHSLAESRGVNWGLPEAARRSTPVARPIRIECHAERLLLLPERSGGGQGKEIALPGSTAEAIDPFIAAVWDHMKAWGIAGRNMYWKPILKVEVAADGEQRFRDLVILLEGSGLEVQRAASPLGRAPAQPLRQPSSVFAPESVLPEP